MKPSRWLAVSLLLLLLLFLSESWLPAVSIHTSKIRRSNREAERVRLLEQLLQRDPSNLLPGVARIETLTRKRESPRKKPTKQSDRVQSHQPVAQVQSDGNRARIARWREGASKPPPLDLQPVQWSGQFEQDRWVALDVYSSMRGGYFVELGANDGLLYSNTVELERHFGWRGLCIEGSLPKFNELQASRPLCTNRYAVVTADDTTVVDEVKPNPKDDPWATGQQTEFKRVEGSSAEGSSAEDGGRTSTSMRTLLRGANAPAWIDFLSLDVEGFELDILAAWPWEYIIGALVVEHNFEVAKRESIQELLRARGYILVHSPTDGTSGCLELTSGGQAVQTSSNSCYPRCPCVDDWFLHPSLFARYNATVKANTSQPPLNSCS